MQYVLIHIAAGDLLRAEVAAGSENGRRAKEFLEKGQLAPIEIVAMVWSRFYVHLYVIINHAEFLFHSPSDVEFICR